MKPAQRPVRSELKIHNLNPEKERPDRWPYLQILRETSNIREFYPEIDPYHEAYRYRDNMWAIFTESTGPSGDPWMFLVVGPEKAMLIDTGFGIGDLKGLCDKLSGGKPLIVVNTHGHPDHSCGNPQFDEVYCNEYDVPNLEYYNTPDMWSFMLTADGQPKNAEFDVDDIVPFKKVKVIGVPNGYTWDLGDNYIVELVHLPGHTQGMSAYYDHVNHDIFVGDTNGIGGGRVKDFHPELMTVEALRDGLKAFEPRFDEVNGVFPGHGALNLTNITLANILDACERVLANPEIYDSIRVQEWDGNKRTLLARNILYGSAIRYTPEQVYKKQQMK